MFSPSSLVQSMIQRSSVTSPKPVELTPGQVFKGTVIKQYPENMALVQIGGIQVQAKLEAKLETGQKAWLQVQPNADVVTLKVLDTPVANGKEASLESLMRSLGLPETKESRALVQALVNANLPVTKEAVQAFGSVVQRLGMDEGTIKAFLMAMKRDLPLTPDTVAGLKAFLSDKPLSHVVQNFLQQASRFLQENQSAPQAQVAAGTNADVRQLLGQIKDKLEGLPVLLMDAEGTEEGLQSSRGQAAPAQTTADASRSPVQGTAGQSAPVLSGGKGQGATTPGMQLQSGGSAFPTNQNAPADQRAAADTTGAVLPDKQSSDPTNTTTARNRLTERPVEPNAVPRDLSSGNTLAASKDSTAAPQASVSVAGKANTDPSLSPQQVSRGEPSISQEQQPVPPAAGRIATDATLSPQQARNPILELLRQLGISHERELMAHTISSGTWDADSLKQMESVKSMLIQLTQSSAQAIPVALREAADQLLQQVTGQQLMMLSPSNQALSQVVLQIPLRTDNGEETAYVQIESQKKGAGQLDAENCRLFFHLQLQELGTTMIDVNIVNKIVNLNIYNDTPGLEALAQTMRDGLAGDLENVGYQLSAMRFQAIPEQQGNAARNTTSAVTSMMADYKGVDLRI